MRKLTTVLMCFLLSLGIQAQTFIQEDFSTFNDSILPPLASGWKNVDSTASQNGQIWRFDNPNPRTLNSPIVANAAILDSDWYGSGNSQDAYLVSPNFDASLANAVILEFDHYFRPIGGSYGLVQINNGTSWVTVDSITTSPDPEFKSIDISAQAAGVANAQIRFRFVGSYAWYWIIDNVSVYQPQPDDIKMISVDSLQASCGLTNAEPIIATFTNAGSNTVNSITLNYTVNGGAQVSETYSTPLLAGDTAQYRFTSTVDMSAVGSYNVTVYSNLRADNNFANDTARGVAVMKNSITTFPYAENFESGPGGWTSGGANSSWAHGTPAGGIINTASSGTQAWVTNLSGDYNNNEESFVISPCFDFSSLSAPQFKARIWIENEFSWDGTVLQSSIDGGLSWQKVGSFGNPNNWYNDNSINGLSNIEPSQEGWTGMGGSWILAENDLTGLAGQPSVELRIVHGTDGSVTEEGFAFDDILVQDAPSNDIGVAALISPQTGCGLTTDSVRLALVNSGSAVINSLPLGYILNGGTPVTGTFTGTINPGDTVIYTFAQTVNLATVGSYTIQGYASLAGDGNQLNDTVTAVIQNIPVIGTLPYSEGFETNNGGWTTYGNNSSWAHGVPTGPFISNAANGVNAWVTNLSGDYNNSEFAYLESPCMDFSTLAVDPIINFSHIFQTESCCDEGWIETSTDGGVTWTKLLDNGAATGWYNDNFNQWWDGSSPGGAGIWSTASNALTGTAGSSSVKIRFVFSSDGSITDDGFGVDDISITPPASDDAAIVALSAPLSQCGLGAADSIKVLLSNRGSNVITTLDLSYSLNNAAFITETYTGSVNPGDTVEYTFNATANFSVAGTYNLTLACDLANDPDGSNDTLNTTVESIPTVNSFPYSENFEASNGGWTTSGTNSSWAHGSPAGPYISAAAGGLNAWVTNLNGDYNNSEFSYLESPCMDFSSLSTDPTLSFSHIFNTESCCDEGWVETSLDGGITWTKLLDNGSAIGWYNDLGNQWWDGNSPAGSGIWASASNLLTGTAGISTVKLRFVFSSDGSVTNDGFGVDDILITPPAADDASIIALSAPTDQCGFGTADSVKILFSNRGSNIINTIDLSYSLNNAAFVTETFTGSVLPGDTVEYTFNATVNLSTPGTYSFTLACDLIGDPIVNNDTLANQTILNSLQTLPYFENFDALAVGQSGQFSNGWTGLTIGSGNFNWLSNSGGTGSGGTGPSADNTTGATNYMYTEASSPAANGDTAILVSPCVDISSGNGTLTLNYFYHMYGSDIQTLFVDLDTNGVWVNVDTLIGQKQSANADPYLLRTLNLNQFANLNEVRVRFWTERGPSFEGDVAIDDVSITDAPVGLGEQNMEANGLAIYPNPSNGLVSLVVDKQINLERIEIYNLQGQLVQNINTGLDQTSLQIDLTNLPKGVYSLRAIGDEFNHTQKLILN